MRDKVTRLCLQTTTFLKRRERRTESSRDPSACQPNALPLGHTGSHSGGDIVGLGTVPPCPLWDLDPRQHLSGDNSALHKSVRRARSHTHTHMRARAHTHKHREKQRQRMIKKKKKKRVLFVDPNQILHDLFLLFI